MDAPLYASRLAKLAVLDPEGTALGRVDDLVVGPPSARGGPPVLGFVVAVPGRRIFVAAGRVLEIGADGLRLATGALNLRRFASRAGEALVLHELLDRPVPGGDDVVNDVGIVRSPLLARGWEVDAVDLVGASRGRLRPARRRPRRTVPWHAVRAVFPQTGADPHAHLRDLHPVELAAAIAALPAAERLTAARALDDEQLADLLEELPEDDQADLVEGLDLERAADVLEAMAPDDAVDLLEELQSDRRRQLLAAMEPDEAEPLRRLLRYPRDTAGGLMNPEPVLLAPDATVAEALAWLRDPDLAAPMAGQVFVVEPPVETPTGPFLGTCSVQRLLRTAPSITLRDVAEDRPEPVRPSLPEAQVAVRMAAYNLLALPVTDDTGHLLGAVTVDDVLDHVLPEGWRAGPEDGWRAGPEEGEAAGPEEGEAAGSDRGRES